MTLDFSKCLLVPVHLPDGTVEMSGVKDHVKASVQKIVDQPLVFLMDDMGMMKGASIIIAAQFLAEAGVIDRVVIVAPSSVRTVWSDPELGELKKHLWLPCLVSDYHSKVRQWGDKAAALRWVVTNYEFIRNKDRLRHLMKFCDGKTMLVLDESSLVKNHRAVQSRRCLTLRKRCGRVVLLNGTPVENHPGDIYSQANILDGGRRELGILGVSSYLNFRARHAIMGGWMQKEILGWRPEGIEEMQRRLAPYVLRRLKKDHLKDLPEKLPPVVRTVTLTPRTWAAYKSMRDDMVAWLSSQTASLAPQAITKIMRLAQITSGFVGGVEDVLADDDAPREDKRVEEIGREKLDDFLEWLDLRLYEDPCVKVLAWSRFRPEVLRLFDAVKDKVDAGMLVGGQKAADREHAKRLLTPGVMPKGPVVVAGTLGTGGRGLTLVGSHTVIRLSNDYSPGRRAQADDRVHRPGQTEPVSYTDVVAVGPKGQRTIDHGILVKLLNKDNVAQNLLEAWVQRPQAWIDMLKEE